MQPEKMVRVNKSSPCPICSKPDWCLIASDKTAAICARIQKGSLKKCGDAGWLHIMPGSAKSRQKRKTHICRIPIDFGKNNNFEPLAKQYQAQLTEKKLQQLSENLQLTSENLTKLNIGWDGLAYTFPMFNNFGKVVGIRKRFLNGNKLSITGSKNGLFIPEGLSKTKHILLICEGPTDTVAVLDLGFEAIGRPNCNCLIKATAQFAKNYSQVVIISDNDQAGKVGATRLSNELSLYCQSVKVIYPPDGIKDLRQWLQSGLTHQGLLTTILQAAQNLVKIRLRNR